MSTATATPAVAGNFFKSSAPGPAAQSEKREGPAFLSFLKKPEGYSEQHFKEGDYVLRLLPPSAEGAACSVCASILPVKRANVEGKILSGAWFNGVNKWLFDTFKATGRLAKFVNGSQVGDIKLRESKRALFFALVGTEKTLSLCELPATPYEGATNIQPGDDFLEGGAMFQNFNWETGSRVLVKVKGSGRNKRYRITEEKAATPLTEEDIATKLPKRDGVPFVPALKDVLRESPREEILECLKETLPADVFAGLLAANVLPA
jgi:hypothetical protein